MKIRLNIPPHIKSMLWGLLYYAAPPLLLLSVLVGRLDFSGIDDFITTIITPSTAVMSVLFVLFFTNILSYVICILDYNRYKNRIIESKKHYVRTKSGPPGTGKSATAGAEAVILAAESERYIKYRYWQLTAKYEEKKILKDTEWEEYRELQEAIEYYSAHPGCIWCLFTDIPIMVGSKAAHELTLEHLGQMERLPPYAVCYIDEIGAKIDNDNRIGQMLERIAELSRYCRHYGEYHIIYTEQEETNYFKDLRRNVAYIERMRSQTPALVPLLPAAINSIIRFFVNLFGRKKNNRLAKITLFLDKFNDFGFRVIKSKRTLSEFDREKTEKRNRAVLPALLNYSYNARTFRLGYYALGQPIMAQAWQSLLLTREHIDKDRAFKERYREEAQEVREKSKKEKKSKQKKEPSPQ